MEYIFHILSLMCIYAILALSMNFIVGYLGILNLGFAAFYGIGAYTFAILVRGIAISGHFIQLSFLASFFTAGIVSAFFGLLLALPTIRLKSHYMAISTLGFLMIIHGLFINLPNLTRGALGIPGIPRPIIFGFSFFTLQSFFLLSFIFFLMVGFILHRILHSPFGKLIEAIREDETAVKSLGKHTVFYKIQAFIVSSFFAGIGGALLASLLGYINPWNFNVDELLKTLAMVIVGGMASFWGSIVGAILIILLPEPLRLLHLPPGIVGPLRYALYGLIIILFMIFRPNGILGKRTNIFSK
ncbi:branched-chain amino acid ABC transporter permease [Candidatus Peregrinibacteria bacterium]|nr:branched-chain amino acid ABC transporter permease [Candidatus Peregrinibacteria bacterium]